MRLKEVLTIQQRDSGMMESLTLETRDILGLCIAASQNAKLPDDRFGVFRM